MSSTMNKQDNFEDNLYLLLIRINLIRDSLALNMDPELFYKRTLEDIDFIDDILGILLKKLQENQHRIDREGLLDHLSEIEWQFSVVLSEISGGSASNFIEDIPALQNKIMNLRKASLERIEAAKALGTVVEDYSEEPVISSNELNELLKDF